MIEENSCKYCGWKVPSEYIGSREKDVFLLCENCGNEIFSESNKNEDLARILGNIKKKKISSCGYDVVPKEKNPIARVLKDTDFPNVFKDNLKIVISRLLYPHLETLKNDLTPHKKKREITREILDDLYEKISPIKTHRIIDIFLTNLHAVSENEFLNWLKLLQKKIKLNNSFNKDFIIYLRWMIREVYSIITELWEKKELPKFERIIRDDLKSF
ncbi:MAG: hypothetical protein ACFFG0_17410, partial [Candidatus Thorarchaeota archaeon]